MKNCQFLILCLVCQPNEQNSVGFLSFRESINHTAKKGRIARGHPLDKIMKETCDTLSPHRHKYCAHLTQSRADSHQNIINFLIWSFISQYQSMFQIKESNNRSDLLVKKFEDDFNYWHNLLWAGTWNSPKRVND